MAGNDTTREYCMRMNPPRVITWVAALILGVLGILVWPEVGVVPKPDFIKVATPILAFWMEAAAFLLLCLGSLFKGL